MNLRYSLIGCLFCWGCSNIEDAKPSERSTFIRFYEAPHNLYGVTAKVIDDGYVILANETLANGSQNSVLIRADKNGERIANDVIINNGFSKCMQVTNDGYYIIGDSIKTNLASSDVADLEIYSARLFKLSQTGAVEKMIKIADRKNVSRITDIHGDALTVDAQGNIITVGTYKDAGQPEKAFIMALEPVNFDTIWYKNYDIIGRNYQNAHAVHITTSGKIIWASDLIIDNQSFSRSYLTIPYVENNSTFLNYGQFGETTDQHLTASDIQPAASAAFGFGVIGTYSSITNTESNLFFIRVNQYGSIIEGSERYFDGERLSSSNLTVSANESTSEDTGNAIIATSDGGFILAGSMNTTPNRGNGGKDILLIKVDMQGNVLWNKVMGGVGDETVSSIRETDDKGLLICGSNDLSGLSSIFLIRTDKNGDLKN